MNKYETLRQSEEPQIKSLEQEQKSTVMYLGPDGNFTQEAALIAAAKFEAIPVAAGKITEIFQHVRNGEVTYGVVPCENSTAGPVADTMKNLLDPENQGIQIIGEHTQKIELYWYQQPGSFPKAVATKDTAGQQSQETRERLYPNIPVLEVNSTGQGVLMASQDPNIAGIGSRQAAELQGIVNLVRSEKSIEDNTNNATTFWIISTSKELPAPTGRDKTTFIMDIPDQPGSLYTTLNELQKRDVNMTKIKSLKEHEGTFSFLVTIDGHQQDAEVADALSALEEICPRVHRMGSYPKADYIPQTTERTIDMNRAVTMIQKEAQNGDNMANKHVMVFTLKNETGALVTALEPFVIRGLNLTKIDSLPSGLHDEYIFYLSYDKDGLTREDEEKLLQEVSISCTNLIFLS